MVPLELPLTDPTGFTTGVDQVYVTGEGTIFPDPFVGVMLNGLPEQIILVWFATYGIGFTMTVNVNVEPIHAPFTPEIGVTV